MLYFLQEATVNISTRFSMQVEEANKIVSSYLLNLSWLHGSYIYVIMVIIIIQHLLKTFYYSIVVCCLLSHPKIFIHQFQELIDLFIYMVFNESSGIKLNLFCTSPPYVNHFWLLNLCHHGHGGFHLKMSNFYTLSPI